MKASDVFPSKYLRSEDLKSRAHLVTISHVTMEPFTDDSGRSSDKPILHFQGHEKGMVLNKTNWGVIAYLLDEDSDNWPGGKIVIAPELVGFKGKMTLAIRVKPPNGAGPKKPPLQNTENPADKITSGPALQRAVAAETKRKQEIANEEQQHDSETYSDDIPF